ncbi:tRNA uracil 4-sulfurtransferase ThiI [Hahella sp. SMD15-11]|uniref:tRNA sulfurtransferase n=1 Tax=Thermohahella caldifontis TaxID=3142973 RepID=A0AB39USH6_9GAMM
MKFLVKLFPEITIKSKPVRQQQSKQLRDNLRRLMRAVDDRIRVNAGWDHLEVITPAEPAVEAAAADVLTRTPGIANALMVREVEFTNLHEIYEHTRAAYGESLRGKRFVVRVKRTGKHPFTSHDAERYVGGGLNQHCETAGVDLHNPEVTIKLEIRDNRLYLIDGRLEGLGGYPLGTQEPVLSLISGGFDSGVASYLTMRRGMKTHFCFFNLGGTAHEVGVKQVSHYLWERYGASHRVKFVAVPFEGVVAEILKNIHHSYMGVVLKRMMYRAAERIAQRLKARALVTGESVAQVSSQTLTNLSAIDAVTSMLVLRPLATMDKQDIINIADRIGTGEFAKNMPEYCGVISDRPTTRARMDRLEATEANFDFSVLDAAVENAVIENLDEVMATTQHAGMVEEVRLPQPGDVVIDIRHPNEQEKHPLTLNHNKVLSIPFYELENRVSELGPDQTYLLYCDKGVMSRLHAAHLREAKGLERVKVLRLA